MTYTVLHLCCGSGGGGLGFRRAGFDGIGAIDIDPLACRDYESLVGEPAQCADLAEMEPADLRALAGPEAPDVLFTSAPCKGFSGCLPEARALEGRYIALNSLAFRSVWLALEAWSRRPPPLVLFENVPRIKTRGRVFVDRISAMLRGYGYAVAETVHDCGVLGGLAQHRRRFLLVARHQPQVEAFLRVPIEQRVRGVGEVLGALPVPVPGAEGGGPMHRLPRLSALNWVRLALIPAGGDWRDIPKAVRLPGRAGRPNGPYGVEDWAKPSHAVLGHTKASDTWGSVADPRVTCRRHEGGHGVRGWEQPSHAIIANATIDNFSCQVADPRLGCSPRSGTMGVVDWAQPSHCVRGCHDTNNAAAAIADPRVPEIAGAHLDLGDKTPVHIVIRAEDGTWHRPMTTLELAALQGFPLRLGDRWLELAGRSHRRWRSAIGNAVPPAAAEAIARSCMATLAASRVGAWGLDSAAVWVSGRLAR